MKKLILIATLTLSTAAGAHAEQQNGLGGLLLGAGGGAVMGQAIGRNTEATLIGTAVGSMVGYMIGNEMDKNTGAHRHPTHHQARPSHHRQQPVVHQHKHVTQYNYYNEPVRVESPPRRKCREAEMLGTINGKARKIYGTVCKTPQGWELISSDPVGKRSKYRHSSPHRDYIPGRYTDESSHWVGHRF